MFDFIFQLQEAFTQAGLSDPLKETLHLCDILSNGALRALNSEAHSDLNLEQLIQQRQAGVPLEYILQRTVFMGRPFTCSPDALIPRAETELLVQTVLNEIGTLSDPLTIVDVGTGSGNITVSLALALPQSKVFALDISPAAVRLAQHHVDKYQLQDRVTVFCGDLFAPLADMGVDNRVDVVVCNPPYIPSGSLEKMSSEIVAHEPLVALDAGPYGINIFRRLVQDATFFLRPGGVLAFEIGIGQETLVQRLLQKSGGYDRIKQVSDSHGTPRVFLATKKRP